MLNTSINSSSNENLGNGILLQITSQHFFISIVNLPLDTYAPLFIIEAGIATFILLPKIKLPVNSSGNEPIFFFSKKLWFNMIV